MNLHLACGSIYLKDYINCDAWGIFASDITDNPNLTTFNNYYKTPFEQDPNKRKRTSPIIDKQLDLLKPWDFKDNSVNEILMICCIEHFSKQQAEFIISECKRVLKSGGVLKIDFPDIKTVVEQYSNNPEYMMELIYCNGKNEYSFHKWGYTRETFREMLGSNWYNVHFTDVVKHDYPMIGCIAVKE